MSRLRSLFLFVLFSTNAFAQSDIAIGGWQSYLPHNKVSHVVQSTDKIIYATDQSLFTIDKEDNSVEYVSTVEGLTETGIEDIVYDQFNNQLIIAYDNSVIDIVANEEVFPVFNIKNNTNFIDRSINDMFVQNQNWLYLATGFGLVQYNLMNRDFGFTLDARQQIFDIDGSDEYLIISGAEGIYVLDYLNENFPNAFTTWRKIEIEGTSELAQDILFIDNSLYVSIGNQIFKSTNLENFDLVYTEAESGYNNIFLKSHESGWIIGTKNLNNNRSKLIFFDDTDTPYNQVDACTNRLLDVEIDEKGRIFFADEWTSVRWVDELGNCNKDFFDGPFSIEATDIDIKDDVVYVASGGISENFADLFGRQGIYILEDEGWNNINQDSNPFYKENDMLQFYQIEAHPTENKYYVGSFWAGLAEYDLDSDTQTLFKDENTGGALGRTVGDEQRTRISGLTFDAKGNLWIALFGAARPLAVKTTEDTWHNFFIGADSKLSDIVVDDLGYVWGVISGNTGGVIVYDAGESIPDPTDDRPSRLFNLNNSELPSNLVNCIAKDLDGAIWVGTAQGAVVFDCGGSAFEDICTGNKRKVVQDSIAAFLLETEDVQAITIDGANRKWFGTRNGIFVMSPSAEEQIAKFDVDNSPLFDNNIKALEYNPNSGEIFVASNKGLQSFRTETTGARVVHSPNVYAFPNPVTPDYQGPIAIKGLARDAEVKITDIDGQLVYQTEALGGQAIWDGRDQSGKMVTGGVYLVFSSSSDAFLDPDTFVTKILLVR